MLRITHTRLRRGRPVTELYLQSLRDYLYQYPVLETSKYGIPGRPVPRAEALRRDLIK